MEKAIIKDPLRLSIKSEMATIQDLNEIINLKDTLFAHREHCVGMAGNMIGVNKRFIAVFDDTKLLILINPIIIQTYGTPYEAEEGCLCHTGTKKTKRFSKIKVSYQELNLKNKIKTFQGFTAQIIQHEIDHCDGILI